MTLQQYLLLMVLGTLVGAASLGLIIWNVSPDDASMWVFLAFYATLFTAVVGVASIIGLLVRNRLHADRTVFQNVELSFRQGVLFAGLVVVALLLQSQRTLTWWNTVLLSGTVSSVEMAFARLGRRRK